MTRALLDVNMLIALLDSAHGHHGAARAWFEENEVAGWATCAITENGVVRIMSNPKYPGGFTAAAVAERLAEATQSPAHQFWPCDISLLDARHIAAGSILGASQVTDVYLLALAAKHRGTFVTFDRTVNQNAAARASTRNLTVIKP